MPTTGSSVTWREMIRASICSVTWILKAMDAPIEQQIHSLEGYTEEELDEKWLYELDGSVSSCR